MNMRLKIIALLAVIVGGTGCDDGRVDDPTARLIKFAHSNAVYAAGDMVKDAVDQFAAARKRDREELVELLANYEVRIRALELESLQLRASNSVAGVVTNTVAVTNECTRQHCTNACLNCGTWRPNQWLGDGKIVTNNVNVEAGE